MAKFGVQISNNEREQKLIAERKRRLGIVDEDDRNSTLATVLAWVSFFLLVAVAVWYLPQVTWIYG